jgi:primosomal protein N'
MADRPSLPWRLRCPWCDFYLVVSARGMRGNDPGSGVEAAEIMADHCASCHGETWPSFIAATSPVGARA